MSLMHYICLISIRDTLTHLKWLLDEVGEHPDLATLDPTRLIERHLRMLLMNEFFADTHIRTVLMKYLPIDQVTLIEETLHDRLLYDVRQYMNMDEDVSVVEVTCKYDGDLYIVIEEREVIRRMATDFEDGEYGRHQIEDEMIIKTFLD